GGCQGSRRVLSWFDGLGGDGGAGGGGRRRAGGGGRGRPPLRRGRRGRRRHDRQPAGLGGRCRGGREALAVGGARGPAHGEGFAVYEAEWWHFDYQDWRKYRTSNLSFEEVDKQIRERGRR